MTACRRAWLTLGSLSVDLENEAGGWFCTSLDLGYPEVRDVVSNRPDQSGVDDRTQYFGSRAISAQLTAIAGAGATIDAVAAAFAPFMVANVRSTLHYVLDRPGSPERTMRVRAAGFSWPIEGPYQRDIGLQFVAADPAALDAVEQTVVGWSGSSTVQGRTYPLTFNRIYPAGGGGVVYGRILTVGDLPIKPRFRIYGPITRPNAQALYQNTQGIRIMFLASFSIPAGQYVDVDSDAKTAYLNGDPSQSVLSSLDWSSNGVQWGVLYPGVTYTLGLSGTTTSGVTQVQAMWHDRYLT